MSNSTSFMPFINTTTGPVLILKAVLARSKGSSHKNVLNLFSIITSVGIDKVREMIESYGSLSTVSLKMNKLLQDNPQYHVNTSEHLYWKAVGEAEMVYVGHKSSFGESTILDLFSVIVSKKPELLKSSGFEISEELIEKYSHYADSEFEQNINSVPGVVITDKDSIKVGFRTFEEFKAYLCCHEITGEFVKIEPVLINIPEDFATDLDYSSKSCERPFERR